MADIKHFDPDRALDTVVRLFWQQGVASTGVQDIVTATGVNRSSLYATFGGKQDLYRAALRRYVESHSEPALRRITEDGRGLAGIADFFATLIEARCAGPYARWGCMIANAHAAAEDGDPAVRRILHQHHERLRDALHAALTTARADGALPPDTDLDAATEHLALLAYGINLRSRTGADAATLHRAATGALASLGGDVA